MSDVKPIMHTGLVLGDVLVALDEIQRRGSPLIDVGVVVALLGTVVRGGRGGAA